ncbi:GNAT family N-acetyltransferase [Streptomyces sp. NPDC003483]
MTGRNPLPWQLTTEEDATKHWISARILAGEPHQKWTFTRFLHRSMVSAEPGLSWIYEELSTWGKVKRALLIGAALQKEASAFPQMGMTFGLWVFDSTLRSRTGRLHIPGSDEKFRGRHSVAVSHWRQDTDEIVFMNDWGKRWGDGGRGYIGRQYFEAYVDSVTLLRPSWFGPAPEMTIQERRPSTDSSMSGYIKRWLTPNKLHGLPPEYAHGHTNSAYRIIETFAERKLLTIAEIRGKDNEFYGRLHVDHDKRTGTCTIQELWVPPQHRRRGIATRLERFASAVAIEASARKLEIPINEADSTPEALTRAEYFTSTAGYSWEVYESYRPNVTARAIKHL